MKKGTGMFEELFKRAIDRSEEYLEKVWPFTGCKRSKGHFRKEVKRRRRRNKLARLSRRRRRQ